MKRRIQKVVEFLEQLSDSQLIKEDHKDRYSKSNTNVNILLLSSFIHIAYLRLFLRYTM